MDSVCPSSRLHVSTINPFTPFCAPLSLAQSTRFHGSRRNRPPRRRLGVVGRRRRELRSHQRLPRHLGQQGRSISPAGRHRRRRGGRGGGRTGGLPRVQRGQGVRREHRRRLRGAPKPLCTDGITHVCLSANMESCVTSSRRASSTAQTLRTARRSACGRPRTRSGWRGRCSTGEARRRPC